MTDERTIWELRQLCCKILEEGVDDTPEVVGCIIILLEALKDVDYSPETQSLDWPGEGDVPGHFGKLRTLRGRRDVEQIPGITGVFEDYKHH